MRKKSLDILHLFSQNEEKVAKLYRIYAGKFPAQKDLWLKIAKEEEEHVKILKKLHEKLLSKNLSLGANKYLKEVIEYIGVFLDERLQFAIEGQISALDAVETALRIEQSMIEKKCFEMMKLDTAEILETFKQLDEETNSHIEIFKTKFGKIYNKA